MMKFITSSFDTLLIFFVILNLVNVKSINGLKCFESNGWKSLKTEVVEKECPHSCFIATKFGHAAYGCTSEIGEHEYVTDELRDYAKKVIKMGGNMDFSLDLAGLTIQAQINMDKDFGEKLHQIYSQNLTVTVDLNRTITLNINDVQIDAISSGALPIARHSRSHENENYTKSISFDGVPYTEDELSTLPKSTYFSAKNITIENGDMTMDISIEGNLPNLVAQMTNGEPIEIDYEDFNIIDDVNSYVFLINGTTSRDELLPIYMNFNLDPDHFLKSFLGQLTGYCELCTGNNDCFKLETCSEDSCNTPKENTPEGDFNDILDMMKNSISPF